MLYILTGSIQSGKTRWLQEVVSMLEEKGISCEGVIAPGIWAKSSDGFIKDGILNELLPTHETLTFGLKPDQEKGIVANINCSSNPSKDSGWYIDDQAVAKVNDHFTNLDKAITHSNEPCENILVIDELGVLELLKGTGITKAMDLLQKGNQDHYKHAIVVVRSKKDLPLLVSNRYSQYWGGSKYIYPNTISPSEFISSCI